MKVTARYNMDSRSITLYFPDLKIDNNTITIPVSAFTAEELFFTVNQETTIQSCAITATGAPIFITCSCNLRRQSADYAFFGFLRLYRDSVKIYDSGEIEHYNSETGVRGLLSFNATDTPLAGNYTYYLNVFINGSRDGDHYACNRSMMLLETKK